MRNGYMLAAGAAGLLVGGYGLKKLWDWKHPSVSGTLSTAQVAAKGTTIEGVQVVTDAGDKAITGPLTPAERAKQLPGAALGQAKVIQLDAAKRLHDAKKKAAGKSEAVAGAIYLSTAIGTGATNTVQSVAQNADRRVGGLFSNLANRLG